jgi:hypothetical protein
MPVDEPSVDRGGSTVTSKCADPVGIGPYLDDLRIFDGEDLVEMVGRRWPRPFGVTGHTQTEDDGVTVDLDAFDHYLRAVGQ